MDSNERLSATERDRISRQIADGWRIRCPRGHASLKDNDGPTVYCGACSEGYHYAELLDASEPGNTMVVSPPEKRE
ncbi:hypothetical protein EGH22_19260 [Halomicroarcula sp. F28]|uniref:hypothetical protein n=1 Tax=Haloarcula salinisoli TaxID=2487746 RepID=UPI001C736AA6|nr:hypothetical protein [Halomicroarcula salinisoli]MBX0288474.1 hypothetical protein [Halomicroarcula salinisoli]